MPYPHDPLLRGFAAVEFRNEIPLHDLDPPVGDPESREYPRQPSWKRELIRLKAAGVDISKEAIPRFDALGERGQR